MPVVQESLATGRQWPTSWGARHEEYKRRMNAYKLLAYSQSELERGGLFQATESGGKVIHETHRINADCAFVADVYASVCANALTLDLAPGWLDSVDADPDSPTRERARLVWLDRGREIWRRSRIEQRRLMLARSFAVYGDLDLEAYVNADGSAGIAWHSPENVWRWYDQFHTDLDIWRVSFEFESGPASPDYVQGEEHTYERWLTRDTVRVREDGKAWEVFPHNLGRVPVAHASFANPDGDPHFGAHSFYRLEDSVAVSDSVDTQMTAVGTRFAAPLLAAIGFTPGDGTVKPGDMESRGIAIPTGGDLKWVEPALSGLQALVSFLDSSFTRRAQLVPAMMFTESGANSSGLALSFRAAQFTMEATPVIERFRGAIAEATTMAVALEEGIPFEEAPEFVVKGGPAVPVDRQALLDAVLKARDAGLLTDEDAVRHLQTLEVVPRDADASEYALDAVARNEAAADEAVRRLQAIQNGGRPDAG